MTAQAAGGARRRGRVRGTVAGLAALGVLGAPAVAGAVIVPQHGMAGVRLGQTEAKVRAVLGPPVRRVDGRNDFGRFRELRYRGLTVTMQGARRVSAVSTGARVERTPAGVGVGSPEAEVRRTVRGVRCGTSAGVRSCVLGRLEPGRTVTVFAMGSGAVRRVTVGSVID